MCRDACEEVDVIFMRPYLSPPPLLLLSRPFIIIIIIIIIVVVFSMFKLRLNLEREKER